MYICLCKGLTDGHLRPIAQTCSSFAELKTKTGVATECGRCEEAARSLFHQATGNEREVEACNGCQETISA